MAQPTPLENTFSFHYRSSTGFLNLRDDGPASRREIEVPMTPSTPTHRPQGGANPNMEVETIASGVFSYNAWYYGPVFPQQRQEHVDEHHQTQAPTQNEEVVIPRRTIQKKKWRSVLEILSNLYRKVLEVFKQCLGYVA